MFFKKRQPQALTGKNLSQGLSSNNEETPAHVFPHWNSGKPSRTFSNVTPPGAASVVIYTLKITELPPGVERKMIV